METIQTRIVFSQHLNDHKTLFGGFALKWMDEVAYITATRATRKEMVTIAVDHLKFKHPIIEGDIISIKGIEKDRSDYRIKIEVTNEREKKYDDKKDLVLTAEYVFTALDINNKPIRLYKAVY